MAGLNVLIINDDEAISRYLADKLSSEIGSAVEYVSNCGLGFSKISQKAPDAIILKYNMPDFNNEAAVQGIKELDPDSAIILFIEEPGSSIFQEINRLGIYDFISLPINLDRLFLLVRKASETHALSVSHRKVAAMLKEQNNSLQKQNALLAKRIEESAGNLTRLYGDLRSTYMRTIKVLAQAIDARDHYTHSHSESVARYAVAIANEMHFSA
ncbi:response regulator, partial [bacterium]